MAPSATSSRAFLRCGFQRCVNPSTSTTLLLLAASIIRRQSFADVASGFSHRMCLPASAALTVHSQCMLIGSALITASISGSASCSSYDPYHRSIPCSSAAALAFEAARDEIETICELLDSREAGRWALMPICEVERRPYRTTFCLIWVTCSGAFSILPSVKSPREPARIPWRAVRRSRPETAAPRPRSGHARPPASPAVRGRGLPPRPLPESVRPCVSRLRAPVAR